MAPPRHNLLRRQLKKIFGEPFVPPPEWETFIEAIDRAYREFDTDRNMLERSLELSSQELLQANSELRAILEALPDLFFRFSSDGTVLDCRAGTSSEFSGIQNQIIGRKTDEIPFPAAREKFNDAIRRVQETRAGTRMEFTLPFGDAEYFYEARFIPLLENQVMAIVRNLTEQKQASEALREFQRRLADIIAFLPDATLVIDRRGKVIAWNHAMESLTGIRAEEMLGKGNHEYALPFYGTRRPILADLVLHPDLECERSYEALHRMGDVISGEVFASALSSDRAHLSATASALRDSRGEIVGAIECIRNNTAQKDMEDRLQRAEKMESLGVLAGGVAHDLNNVLGALVGYSELLLMATPEGGETRQYAEIILQGGERAAAIIQDLLTMARRNVSTADTVNLNDIVTGFFGLPEFAQIRTRHPGVTFHSELAEGLFNIKGSAVPLTKTLMNLLANAAESIHGQGTVTVTTENRYVDLPLPGYENAREGEYAVLTVTDTGSGISPADLDRIFEPFYTRKIMGRSGTGLGLTVVWGTVQDHGGYIDVKTQENRGTSFVLFFPVTREVLSQTSPSPAPDRFQGQGESILVVDDVEEQRRLAARMLGSLNYRVETAASGEAALAHLRIAAADLVVLDMIMEPGIDGLETYRRILQTHPRQKGIIVSGFAMTDMVRKAQELGMGEFVRKPYVIERLGMAVRRELDRGQAPDPRGKSPCGQAEPSGPSAL